MPFSLQRRLAALLRMRFVHDMLTMQFGTLLYLTVTFGSSIAFARLLGKDTFGVYAVITSFVAMFALLCNLGQGTALFVFLAEEHGKKSIAGMSAVLRNYLNIACINAAVLLRRPLLVKGEPGTGKTVLAHEIAKLQGNHQAVRSINYALKSEGDLYARSVKTHSPRRCPCRRVRWKGGACLPSSARGRAPRGRRAGPSAWLRQDARESTR